VHGSTPVFMAKQVSIAAFKRLGAVIAKQKAVLDENREMLREFLGSQSKLDYVWPEYGAVIALRLKQGDADKFCERLRNEFQVGVVPGRFFEMPQHVRVGVGIPTDQLRESLAQFGKALNT
jgi:aspartate/methionine/tyrosine aminotransferase